MFIPLTKPFWGKREEKAVVEAIRSFHGSGDGPYTATLVKKVSDLTGSRYILPVTSGTHGLELAMVALELKSGDEVIIPSYTMSSTANCVVLAGGKPVFADIENRTFGIDPTDIQRCITKKTKGIIVVHYAGMPCDIESILAIAKKSKLFVVEDAAHAIGAQYKGKALGTFGDIGVYSFHGTKNISCGEGGAVVTNRKDLADAMEIYRANGTNRKAFLKGEIKKYSWVGKGSSYFLSDILASIMNAQLDQIITINNKRKQIADYFTKHLKQFKTLIDLPRVPRDTKPNWHIYALRFFNPEHRTIFCQMMKQAGIEATSHFVPLHSSLMGKKIGGGKRQLPVTDEVARTLVRLPIYPGLTKKELTYITKTARKALASLL